MQMLLNISITFTAIYVSLAQTDNWKRNQDYCAGLRTHRVESNLRDSKSSNIDLVDKIIYVNLEEDNERRSSMINMLQERAANRGVPFDRFPGLRLSTRDQVKNEYADLWERGLAHWWRNDSDGLPSRSILGELGIYIGFIRLLDILNDNPKKFIISRNGSKVM
jgi:hypothetical protein